MSRLDQPHGRGEFFTSLGKLLVGFVAEQMEEAITHVGPSMLRPPGALDELSFLTACTRCDKCALACPQGSIMTAPPSAALAMGTPYLVPRAMPCFLCEDLPCVAACPEGALLWPRQSIGEASIEGPKAVRMGLAVVDESRCLTFPRSEEPALECRTCLDRCPYPEEAIRMVALEEGSVPRPEINPALCTGCGLCAFGCASPEAAIRIEPKK